MATSLNAMVEEPEPGTLPPPGKVKEVRREWAVREDGAFAMQLQEEEIEQHYSGNISRRRTVRKDLVVAKDVQHEEDRVVQEALMKRIEEQRRIEELDRAVASSMQEALEREQERKVFQKEADELWLKSELDAQRRQELEDEELAKKLQDRERRRLERISAKRREKAAEAEKYHRDAAAARDGGASADSLESDLQLMKVGSPRRAVDLPPEGYLDDFVENNADPGLNDDSWAYARLLQEQEKQNVNVARKDRAVASTAQDEEIARYLQDRERQLFVKGIRERAKIKHSKSDHSHLQHKLQQDYKRQVSAPTTASVVRGSSGAHGTSDSAAGAVGGSVVGATGGLAAGASGTGSHDRHADSRGSSLGRNETINTEVKERGVSFHKFPKDHDRLHRWLVSMRNNLVNKLTPEKIKELVHKKSVHWRVCSDHFEPGCSDRLLHALPDQIPPKNQQSSEVCRVRRVQNHIEVRVVSNAWVVCTDVLFSVCQLWQVVTTNTLPYRGHFQAVSVVFVLSTAALVPVPQPPTLCLHITAIPNVVIAWIGLRVATTAVRDVAPDSQPLQDVADTRSRGGSSSSSSPRGTTSNDSTPNFENINIASLIDPTCRDRPPEHLTSEQQGGQHWVSVKKVNLPPTACAGAGGEDGFLGRDNDQPVVIVQGEKRHSKKDKKSSGKSWFRKGSKKGGTPEEGS
ncbi:Coiled-coil domain containing 50 [Branchiostoma belcheri]|nr:Coiled-coil domain containing 50 [Branchiostoma belcheri]